MKIQIINYSEEKETTSIIYTLLATPRSLDEFDINIIDLTDERIWYCDQRSFQSVICINDLKNIGTMIAYAKNTKIIFVLPQDINIHILENIQYTTGKPQKKYSANQRFKDNQIIIAQSVYSVFFQNYTPFETLYENTNTIIGELTYRAAFYFKNKYETLSYSTRSDKPTTIKYNDSIYLTTLDIFTSESHLMKFVNVFFQSNKMQETPTWMNDICFFDDNKQKSIIEQNKKIIVNANEAISKANLQLENNKRIKSILYTTGEELVDVVLTILEKLLEYSFSDFVDKKQEDFLVKKDNYTLIGEIKGINTNVRNENISQLENHYQIYQDRLQEEEKTENVHQLLIINPLRKTPLYERKEIDKKQIDLAVRNGSLIVETKTLLKMYELFLQGRISVSDCENIYLEKTGLLLNDDLKSFDI